MTKKKEEDVFNSSSSYYFSYILFLYFLYINYPLFIEELFLEISTTKKSNSCSNQNYFL